MEEYDIKEAAVVKKIYNHFQKYVDHEDQVVAGAIDLIFKQLVGEGKKYGCLVEFGGGARTRVEPFKRPIWQWTLICVFIVRFTGELEDVEDELRGIINLLSSLFNDDHTLGGLTPLVRIERIDQPEVIRMNDIPMYWLPFEISVLEGPD